MPDKDRGETEGKPEDTSTSSESGGDEEPSKGTETAKAIEHAESSDDAAARVADALGVGGDDGAPAGEPEESAEAKAPTNRAARRREEATARKRRAKPGGDDLPKDKNARAKELLARRREQAAERRPVQLLPGEMVEDALSRMTTGVSKWVRKNFAALQWGILAILVGIGGVLFYLSRVEKKDAASSDVLAEAVAADRGRVVAEDKRSEEEKELDPTKVFKTSEERADTALAAYNKVIDEHPGTGAALLAKLGQAGALLDKNDHAHALDAYNAVVASPLAGADPDVKGRAIEGVGFAKEGKGDLDGALAAFKDLESIDAKGFKELALYHQARVLLAKGDTEKAKELLKSAREKLQAPSVDGRPFQFLEAVVDETLRKVDPTAVPPRTSFGGPKGSAMTKEEIEELLRKARENAQKKAGDGDKH